MPLLDCRQARTEVRRHEVLPLLGWAARRRVGAPVRGARPMHRPPSPTSRALAAHRGRGIGPCFRCGARGNALALWARVTGPGIYPAVPDLYRRLGRAVPWLRPTSKKGY